MLLTLTISSSVNPMLFLLSTKKIKQKIKIRRITEIHLDKKNNTGSVIKGDTGFVIISLLNTVLFSQNALMLSWAEES